MRQVSPGKRLGLDWGPSLTLFTMAREEQGDVARTWPQGSPLCVLEERGRQNSGHTPDMSATCWENQMDPRCSRNNEIGPPLSLCSCLKISFVVPKIIYFPQFFVCSVLGV